MSAEKIQLDWLSLKNKIQIRWDKFQETDLEKFRGNMHLIALRVESLYGISKSQARQEYADFLSTLETKASDRSSLK